MRDIGGGAYGRARRSDALYYDEVSRRGLCDMVARLEYESAEGAGTCEVEGYDDGVDEGMDGEWRTYAPPTWYLSCGHEVHGSERPRYCSACGRRVVDD